MKTNIICRQVEISQDLKDIFEKKLDKLDKYFKDDAVSYITLRSRKNEEILELTISSSGTLFRAEEAGDTFNNAFDKAIETIVRQIRKNKTRLQKRIRDDVISKEVFDTDVQEEEEFNIRIKKFAIKPMTVDDAILQMNLLEHTFFMFENADTGAMNVVYKCNNGNYGLIIPE